MKTTPTAKSVEAYISQFPKEIQDRLTKVRQLVLDTVPNPEEKISYGMPAYRYGGSYQFYFNGYDKHVGIYGPNLSALGMDDELKPYRTGKATLRFPHNKPLPTTLIKQVLLKTI